MATIRRCVSVPTDYGLCSIYSFSGLSEQIEHVVLRFGNPSQCPLVRVHSSCVTGEVFSSCLCDCADQLKEAKIKLSERGGYLIYLFQEGRGIGLYNKIDAYSLQKLGYDTYEANEKLNFERDPRSYQAAAEMLKALQVDEIILLSNNRGKQEQLEKFGIKVLKRENTAHHLKSENQRYLATKKQKGGHDFDTST